ncbi:MAG: baseplate J/gp47 family protein [Dehalococcoidia bacterium]
MQQEPWQDPYALAYLAPDDDIATICGKVDTAPHQQVALLAPKGNKALASLVGMSILSRHADTVGRDIALVSPKGGLRSRARAEGIRTFRWVRWVKFDDKPPAHLRISLGSMAIAMPAYRTLWRLGLRLVVVGAALVAAYLFIPSATIVIHPEGQPVSQTLRNVTASASAAGIDFDTMTVPAHFAEAPMEMDMVLVTTGTVTVAEGTATGTVVFSNETEEAVVIPKGTEVAAQSGVNFRTLEGAVLAAGKGETVEVPIEAAKPGSGGNVRATDITVVRGSLRAKLLVTNPAPTEGGGDSEAQGVSAGDVTSLRSLAQELMLERGLEALAERQAEEGVLVYPETARVVLSQAEFSHKVGEATPWLIITAKGRVKTLAVEEEHIRQLAVSSFNVSGDERKVLDGSLAVDASLIDYDEDDETARLDITAEMKVVDGLDEKQIIHELRGRSASSARDYLREYLTQELRLGMREPPEVKITPGWGFGVPRFDWRISLKLEGPDQASQEEVEGGEENGVQSQEGS